MAHLVVEREREKERGLFYWHLTTKLIMELNGMKFLKLNQTFFFLSINLIKLGGSKQNFYFMGPKRILKFTWSKFLFILFKFI